MQMPASIQTPWHFAGPELGDAGGSGAKAPVLADVQVRPWLHLAASRLRQAMRDEALSSLLIAHLIRSPQMSRPEGLPGLSAKAAGGRRGLLAFALALTFEAPL